ncbi:Por secretion system C-terminal sorting domain-containing protein [Mariniphaga anaerophila]|uniref:Por secretion system C-terminal sorting domain-containing protein n=1 Tax=Mariniphaga anaerophila TaxID=1484053 RepID=A0A1M4ZSE4_9BACT|nr:T9SS type A sorting domain-containing protein [Mariniphaga anaerophila]SHF20934.1 Por secretion system C-terminal sorting domain-containing protein [Mariniphaga anaerophila]
MKRLFVILWLVSTVLLVSSRGTETVQKTAAPELTTFASDRKVKTFVPASFQSTLKSQSISKTVFKVTPVDLTSEAERALNYAISIWEGFISSPVPINVQATMESLDSAILCKSRPASFYMNFDGALHENVYYPVVLAEKLSGEEINQGDFDIICRFNKNLPWYFGTDGNTPETHYDFVTAVLHEIAHGLGFSGFFKDDGAEGFFNNGYHYPSIYDLHIFNDNKQQLANSELFPSPSSQLHSQLVSGKLRFLLSDENEKNARFLEVYSPSSWNDGTSIYHLLNSEVELMMPVVAKGLAVHYLDEQVQEILGEIGWSALTFNFILFKDFEEPCSELPVEIEVVSDEVVKDLSVSVVFSTDDFLTTVESELDQKGTSNVFKGNIPLNFFEGKVDYYFEAKTKSGKSYKFPAFAPVKVFSLKIGPDFTPPVVAHNPLKILPENQESLIVKASATDNLGVKKVTVEYKLNEMDQPAIELGLTGLEKYSGSVSLNMGDYHAGKVEYRIVAEDKSSAGNKKYLPSEGFYQVAVFKPSKPVVAYSNDFESGMSDFVGADFSVSPLPGFADNVLHTANPYPVSALKDEKYDIVAELKHPIILRDGGEMSFDEVVLVEPGEKGTVFSEELFWDFVIVEGSRDQGLSWLPFVPGYDSGFYQYWDTAFVNSTVNNLSQASGNQSMFLKRVIRLTENTGFADGDTVLFRFRLASDNSLNGWGWAIDNLQIQANFIDDNLNTQNLIDVFPNPFDSRLYLKFSSSEIGGLVDISITDITGRLVYRDEGVDPQEGVLPVKLSSVNKGIYLVMVAENGKVLHAQKIVKM